MTQNVLQIPTAAPLSGMALVTDVNNALAGLASLCSGGTAPSASSLGLASLAGLLWHDTQANQLKLRNQADSAWIVLGSVNETSGVFVPAAARVYSPLSAATTLALANAGQFLLCSAALTLTLPTTSGLTTAWCVSIFAKGGPVNLSLANSSDALNGGVGGSIIVPKGYYAELVTDAAGNYSAVVIPASLGISVLASAATVDLGTAASQVVSISGTTSITSFGASAPAGTVYTLQFAASLTLAYNAASLILPGAANLTTAANDCAQVLSLGSGNWICIDYQKANGQAVASALGSSPAVRQTALVGVVNSSGQANFVNSGTALRPGLSATAATLLLAFASGYGSGGAVDYVEQIAADSTTFFPTLTANGLSYLYATRVSAGNVTGGATLAPAQVGGSYNQAAQSLLQFGGAAGSTSFLDDFGSIWTAQGTAKVQANQFKFGTGALGGGGTNNAMNGTSDWLKSTAITSLGSGGWSMRAWVYNTAWSSNQNCLFCLSTAGGYGTVIGINPSGHTVLNISSNGMSNDIANVTVGTATIALNTWAFVEMTYDPVAGKIYTYVNGVVDQTISTSGKTVFGGSPYLCLGSIVGIANYFMQGYIDKPEILPYCQHPAGATYSVPTSAPSISAAGYASDWFDTVNMVMKSPSAASTVAGSNPTLTVSNKLYLGEATAGASAISSVVSYAYQGRYDSGAIATLPGTSTAVMLNHNLGTKLAAASIVVECLTSEQGYAAGTRIINPLVIDSTASSRSIPPTTSVTTKVVTFATNNGGGPWTALPAAGGAFAGLTNANWAYRVLVSRSF